MKRWTIYDEDVKSSLQLMRSFGNKINEVVDGFNSKTDLKGNHLGSWQGLNRPTLSEEGMRATVEKLDKDFKDTVNLIYPTMTQEEIQEVLNLGGNIVFKEGEYNLNFIANKTPYCFNISSNTNITFENATLKCVGNDLNAYSILRVMQVENVHIKGGTIVGDKYSHTTTTGEQGFGINIDCSKNIIIEDVTLTECWGDGVYIGANETGDTGLNNFNIILRNVKSIDNRRQGLSIVKGRDILIDGGEYSETSGTLPSAGIDIEPNNNQYVENVTIKNAKFENNEGEGILITQRTDVTSSIKNVVVDNNYISTNLNGVRTSNVEGNTKIVNNEVFNNSKSGISIGVTTGVIVEGNTCHANGVGINISTNADGNIIRGNMSYENTNGLVILTSNKNTVANNQIFKNRNNGISIATTCVENIITGNNIYENSQSSHETYSNIKLESRVRMNNIQGNTIRRGDGVIQPGYGILCVSTDTNGNLITNNDCYRGGSIAGISSLESENQYGGGNKVLDGTWSTTPL